MFMFSAHTFACYLFLHNPLLSLLFMYVTQEVKVSSAAPGSLQHTLEERVAMYKTALQNAKTAGETSKARRYDRGLKVSGTPA